MENNIISAVTSLSTARNDFNSKMEFLDKQISARRRKIEEIEKEIVDIQNFKAEINAKVMEIDNAINTLREAFNITTFSAVAEE